MTYTAKNPFGGMQGRLLPKYRDRYQAHPVGYWQEEFAKAAELGLDCIEFILDFNDAEANPLMLQSGIDEILRKTGETGVKVYTVCADYFIEAPLHHSNEEIASHSQSMLRRLLHNGIVIPCVDQSSMRDSAAQERFAQRMRPMVDEAEALDINLSLETDLAPQSFAALLALFDSSRVTVNYDTGNSAALGFDPHEELACYGKRISDIHIKDRILGGGSVVLGTGDTQFDRFFEALRPIGYKGPLIMQAYRDDEGEAVFQSQLTWIRQRLLPWIGEMVGA